MKKISRFLVLLLLGAGVAAAESSPATLKIGVAFPLTGDLAFYGEPEKNGALLAAEEINAQGGVKGRAIELLIEDNAFSPAKQATLVKRFIEIDHVDALLTAWTPLTYSIIPMIDQARLPTFTWMVSEIGHMSRYLFNTFSDIPQGARAMVQQACRDGVKRAVFLSAESNEVEPVDAAVLEESAKCGLKVQGPYKYDLNTVDFRGILTKLKAVKSDALFLMVFPQHFATVLKQAAQLGMDKQRLYDFGCAAPDETVSKGLEAVFEKMALTSTWYTGGPDALSAKAFGKNYEHRFHSSPLAYAAMSYQAMQLFRNSFDACLPDSNDLRACVADMLIKQGKQDGPAGRGEMDEDGDFHLPVSLMRFERGRFEVMRGSIE